MSTSRVNQGASRALEPSETSWVQYPACRKRDPKIFVPIGTMGPAQQHVSEANVIGARCAALRQASRRDVDAKTAQLQAILGAEQLRQAPVIQSAYAAIVTSEAAIIEALSTQIDQLGAVVSAHFGPHPDAEIYASQQTTRRPLLR